jgi:hypothetical protein
VVTGDGKEISVLLGKGDGTFIEAATASPQVAGKTVFSADLNHDGKVDLITGGDSGIVVLLGNGNGTFTQSFAQSNIGSVYLLTQADFNHDGNLDILTGSTTGVFVLLGNGDGTFQQAVALSNVQSAQFFAVADFHLDNKPDIVVVDGTGTVLYPGNGDGTFQLGVVVSPAQSSVVAGDFNGDGKPDLVSMGSGSTAQFLAGKGDGTFQPAVALPTIPLGNAGTLNATVLSAGDFNNDGKLDLAFFAPVTMQPTFEIGVVLGNGDGTFQSAFTESVPGPTSMIVTDINMDGNLDVVANNGFNISVLLGKGDGTLQPFQLFGLGVTGGSAISAADFNGDGLPDLAAISIGTPSPWLLFQVGSGAGSVTLSPSGLTFAAQLAGGSSATQTITVTNTGSAAATIAGIPVSDSDFTETNTCTNSLAAGTTCTITVTFAPTTAGAKSGSLTVTLASGNLVATLAGSGTDLSLSASGSASSTVSAGQTATYNLSIAPMGGFTGSATLSCSGAPTAAMCMVNPTSVNFSASSNSPASLVVSVTTVQASGLQMRSPHAWKWEMPMLVVASWTFVFAFLSILWKGRRLALRRAAFTSVLTLTVVLLMNACGGGSGGKPTGGTPAGTYAITVTATAQNATRTAKLSLVVQ